jgi:hypothetical protein
MTPCNSPQVLHTPVDTIIIDTITDTVAGGANIHTAAHCAVAGVTDAQWLVHGAAL